MNLPTLKEARVFLSEAQGRNPGAWIDHSAVVARAAEAIATYHPDLDPYDSYIMGLLHDIGRQEGVTDMRHILDGYRFLRDRGFDDAARICLTHSFPIKDVRAASGKWDCSEEEFQLVKDHLAGIEYDEYDRLFQLCDGLALPSGFCLLEKRLVDVTLRHGINEFTVEKWKATLDLQQAFEKTIGQSIYSVLPGVMENTFGLEQSGDKS
jgi:hypothetical protein